LAWNFAPIFIQDVAAAYDRIGRLKWSEKELQVDSTQPAMYYYFSHTLLNGKPLLQINYVIWYSARAGRLSPWYERGRLDGLTVRLSLDSQAKIIVIDVINNCGCYHLFAPRKEEVEGLTTGPAGLGPFVPQWLPEIPPERRLGVRVNSGWHQVQRLFAPQDLPPAISYQLVPYEILEALPREDGRTESIFDCRGIVKGSDRIERFFFFPMGVPRVGFMRQRGHHAVEFIGRAHFDDPDLFQQYFRFR
jgi:hypothetical protein